MFAKNTIVLALIFSLLFASQAVPAASPVVKGGPAECVRMACGKECCHSKACCGGSQQQHTPESPGPLAPRPELQVAPFIFQRFTLACGLRPAKFHFVILDEVDGGHALPPLAVSCIQLI